jgi:hypothetical protein
MKKFFIIVTLLALISCRSKDWDSQVGSYNYDNALVEYGPPEQTERMSNGNTVCKWTLAAGAAWIDKLILVFDKNGRLVSGQEKRF